jgi:hypothetical protein
MFRNVSIEVFNLNPVVSPLLLFASLPGCNQNQGELVHLSVL